jgi:hypothetical protein
MPSYKKNTPPTFNNLIIELLNFKLYKEAYQPINNKPSIMSLTAQLLLNQFYIAPIATLNKK